MKNINEHFTDEEHKVLVRLKNELKIKNWHDFIIAAAVCLSHDEVKEE